ncbi:MAG: hypothetical protein WB347_10300, partial [Terriglobales bacterium]
MKTAIHSFHSIYFLVLLKSPCAREAPGIGPAAGFGFGAVGAGPVPGTFHGSPRSATKSIALS